MQSTETLRTAPAAVTPVIEMPLLRVAYKRAITADTFLFDLVSADGSPLPAFTAGAHLPLKLGDWLRHYSLCNAPEDRTRYQIAIHRTETGRGGSRAFCDLLDVGDQLTSAPPVNHFPLTETAHHALLIAGGIGITPMIAMAHALHARGDTFMLHYAVRDSSRIGFTELLNTGPFAGNVRLHLDDASPSGRLDIHALLHDESRASHIYICGPAGMIDAVLSRASALGWPAAYLHSERFGVPATVVPRAAEGAAAFAPSVTEKEFEVVVASTGKVIPVMRDQTIVQALAIAGVQVPVSCEQGVCGACQTGVLDGVPDHQDYLLSDEERDSNKLIMPCCSRSCSARLTLDL